MRRRRQAIDLDRALKVPFRRLPIPVADHRGTAERGMGIGLIGVDREGTTRVRPGERQPTSCVRLLSRRKG